jgi:hydrogenase maturation protease
MNDQGRVADHLNGHCGPEPSLQTLVIGYGSPIRGDDALGPLVADRIAERLANSGAPKRAIEVMARHILTAELVDDLIRARRVIFIDAAADSTPGTIRRQRLFPSTSSLSTMAHFHDPRELLAWCDALYRRTPEGWLFSVGGADWDYACYRLSSAVEDSVEPLIEAVLELVEQPPTTARD